MNSRRSGFTLVELALVVFIMGLMASFAVLSVRDHIDRARSARSFDQLEHLDRIGRIAARNESTPYQLSFNRSDGKVELQSTGLRATKNSLRVWKLPKGLQFVSFRVPSSSTASNKMSIEINPSGQSPTYAVALKASSASVQWLVTLGVSGQHIRMENADDVAAMFPR